LHRKVNYKCCDSSEKWGSTIITELAITRR
jgi:hypothetical protein